jgi:hypothetical protein
LINLRLHRNPFFSGPISLRDTPLNTGIEELPKKEKPVKRCGALVCPDKRDPVN